MMTWNLSGYTQAWESEFVTDSQKWLVYTCLGLTGTEDTIRKLNPYWHTGGVIDVSEKRTPAKQ